MAANSFRQMLGNKTIRRTDSGMLIKLDDIHVREGFNDRRPSEKLEAHIERLKRAIMAGNPIPHLQVVANEPEGVRVIDGHCRREAYIRARAEGAPVEWIGIVQFKGDEAQQVAFISASASSLALEPIERANNYRRLRAFNWTEQQIAESQGRDVEHVRRYLDLADAPVEVKAMVAAGEVSATRAVREVRKEGEAAVPKLKAQVQEAKAQGKRKVTDATVQKVNPRKLLADFVAVWEQNNCMSYAALVESLRPIYEQAKSL